jgi:hypothetical protein
MNREKMNPRRHAEAELSPAGTIVRSNEFLSIGAHRATGKAFVEEKVSGETWVWDWRQIAAADLSSFSGGGHKSLKPLEPFAIVPATDGFAFEYREPWGRFRCSVELSGSDVLFRVHPDVLYPCALGAVQFPSTLRPEGDTRPVMLDTVNGGRLHRPSSGPLDFTVGAEECWMRYYAVLGKKSAYLSILEPGFDAVLTSEDTSAGSLHLGWVHTPRLGTFEQSRTQRFRFVSSSSYVIIARAYRSYAMKEGLYRSLRDKLEECPSLKKLFGGVLVMLGYLQDPQADYAQVFRQLKKAGVEKAYVYPVGYFNFNSSDDIYPGYRSDLKWINLPPETLQELRRLDYLFAPWIWVKETVESSSYCEPLALHRADGSKQPAWQVGHVQWYANHEGRALEMLKQAAPELRARYTAAHFDGNSGPCLENFGEWSYDKRTDAGYRNAIFAEFSGHDRVVSCNPKDWALPHMHFGTNKQPGPYGRDALHWPVPLWQLSFHDAMMDSWWEHSTYNDPALGHDFSGGEIRKRMLLDILTGDLPSVCPVGRHLGWKNPGSANREMFAYQYEPDDPVTHRAIAAAVEVAQFNARHATDDLVHHEFLSDDGLEQRTEYASGTQVKIRLPDPQTHGDQGELKIS